MQNFWKQLRMQLPISYSARRINKGRETVSLLINKVNYRYHLSHLRTQLSSKHSDLYLHMVTFQFLWIRQFVKFQSNDLKTLSQCLKFESVNQKTPLTCWLLRYVRHKFHQDSSTVIPTINNPIPNQFFNRLHTAFFIPTVSTENSYIDRSRVN